MAIPISTSTSLFQGYPPFPVENFAVQVTQFLEGPGGVTTCQKFSKKLPLMSWFFIAPFKLVVFISPTVI